MDQILHGQKCKGASVCALKSCEQKRAWTKRILDKMFFGLNICGPKQGPKCVWTNVYHVD